MPTLEEPMADTAAGAMRDCLLRLRQRAEKAGRTRDVAEIDAALANDPEAEIRRIIGDAALTPRQRDVAHAIYRYRQANGFSPTMQELSDELGTSKVTIFEHVNALERKRVVTRDKHKVRSLQLVNAK